MAGIILVGKVKRIHQPMTVKSMDGNGTTESISFDLEVTRKGKARVSDTDPTKSYKKDYYRCTCWGKNAVNFYKCTNNGTSVGRIVSVDGNMLQDSYPVTGQVCIDSSNPLHALLWQYANASMGIQYDRDKNTFTIMGGYMQKCINISVSSFDFQDYPDSQPAQGGAWGGPQPQAQGGAWGGQQPAQNGWGNQPTTNNAWGGQQQQANGWGNQQQPAQNAFNTNAGLQPQQQSQPNNGWGNQQPAQPNNAWGNQQPQETNGFAVVDEPQPLATPPVGFNPAEQVGQVPTNIPAVGPGFTPDDDGEEQAF